MKHIQNRWFLVWAVSLVLVACEDNASPINIALEPDYRGVLEAISQSTQPLAEKLALIEASQRDGLADNQTAIEMIRQAVASMGGTLEEKLNAISAAVQSQATGLETKLALIEAAVASGFAGSQAQLALLQQAIAALGGTLDEKLAAVEAAVKAQEMSLATKLNLIEAAAQGGFADSDTAQALVEEAIASLDGTLEEKIAALEAAIGDTSTALSAKMALIETAVKEGFAEASAQQALIKTALDSVAGPVEEKLAAVEAAVASQTTSLETKQALIETAVEELGERVEDSGLGLVLQAIASLGGTLDTKLAAIEAAVNSQTTSLSSKLALIETALTNGFADERAALSLVQTALGTLKTQLDDVDKDLSDAIDDVITSLDAISATLSGSIAQALTSIFNAVEALPDYSQAVAGMQQALADLKEAIVPFRLEYVEDPALTALTTAVGGTWCAVFKVDPADKVIDETMLKLDILSRKQFFPTWGNNTQGNASTDSYPLSLVSLGGGKYAVNISCQSPYVIWDEVTVALSVAYGNTQEPKYITSEPFTLVMMPKALDGLKYWTYPAASFTFKRNGSINNIYYSLDSGVFETQDESDTRTYSAAFIDSVEFLPVNDSVAPVFIELDKEKQMLVFIPDTLGVSYTKYWPEKDPSDQGGRRLWKAFLDSSGVKHETVQGKLVLTDRWKGKDTIKNFRIAWYNSVWFPENAVVSKDQIQDDNTAEIDIRTMLSKLGLEKAWLQGRYVVDEQYGELYGYKKMSAQLVPETLKLGVRFLGGEPAIGDKFGVAAHIDLWTYPSETNPTLKIQQLSFYFNLVVTIVN